MKVRWVAIVECGVVRFCFSEGLCLQKKFVLTLCSRSFMLLLIGSVFTAMLSRVLTNRYVMSTCEGTNASKGSFFRL